MDKGYDSEARHHLIREDQCRKATVQSHDSASNYDEMEPFPHRILFSGISQCCQLFGLKGRSKWNGSMFALLITAPIYSHPAFFTFSERRGARGVDPAPSARSPLLREEAIYRRDNHCIIHLHQVIHPVSQHGIVWPPPLQSPDMNVFSP